MRCTYLILLTCCLLVSTLLVSTFVAAQDESASTVASFVPSIPRGLMAGSLEIEKEISIEAKDIIVNIGKVDIEIEKNQRKEKEENKIKLADTETENDSDDESSAALSSIVSSPSSSISIEKEIEIEAKDIIVNIGKVNIEIEKDERKEERKNKVESADVETENYPPTPSTSIEKEIEIEAKDIIVNIGKVKVEIEKDDHHSPTHKPTHKPTYPTHKPTYPTKKPIGKPPKVDSIPSAEEEETSDDDTTLPLFEDFTPSAEPTADEVVLGENATAAAITVQGGEHFDERGVLIFTGPQIFSVTFKIVKEKVITIKGSDLNVEGGDDKNRKRREAVTFIIRGRGFVPGRELFTDIEDVVGSTSRGGMFDFLEPRVFLGAIPLKVVRFTDTTILARFLDFEDQRRFEAGTLLARVKVLHVEIREKKEKNHGPEDDIGILGEKDRTEVVSVGGLVLPALGAIGGSITSGPVLGVVGIDGRDDHHDDHNKNDDFSNSLLGLFSGLRFDTAVLAVQFSEKDAQRIRGSFNTLFTDDTGLGFPDI